MLDQAHDLRRLARHRRFDSRHSVARPALLAVAGGKGGVGTSTVALNLAAAASRTGRRTVFVGADVGQADRLLDSVFGARLDAELVIIDVGNPIGGSGGRICQSADVVLMVTTPGAAAVVNTFAALESLADGGSRTAGQAGDGTQCCYLLVNMAADVETADRVHRRLAWTARRLLGLELRSAGCLKTVERPAHDEKIRHFFLNFPHVMIDTLGQLLISDRLLKWQRGVKFNSHPEGSIAETVEMDF